LVRSWKTSDIEQTAPDVEAGERVIDFGGGEKALRLLESGAGGRDFDGRVFSDAAGAAETGKSGLKSGAEVGGDGLVLGLAGANGGGLGGLLLAHGEAVHDGEGDGEAETVVLGGGREAVEAAEAGAVEFEAGGAAGGDAFYIELRAIGAVEGFELGFLARDAGVLLEREGIGGDFKGRLGTVGRERFGEAAGSEG
jgi:hypothetical protein